MEKLIAPGEMAEQWRLREPSSILVMRFKALGDIALSLPIARSLRSRFPRAQIRYLCRRRYAEALEGARELDRVLILPDGAGAQLRFALALRRERIDCVIDLLASPRSAVIAKLTGAKLTIGMDTRRHNWCYDRVLPRAIYRLGMRVVCYTLDSNEELIRLLGLPADERRGCGERMWGELSGGSGGYAVLPRERGEKGAAVASGAEPSGATEIDDRYAIGFPAADPERAWAREFADGIAGKGRRIAGLVPAALYQAKSWREERFMEVARRMREEMDAAVVVLWGPGERELAERVAAGAAGAIVAPPMGVSRLGALIGALDCLVGIDSGPKHLAVIQGVPTVTLFGPTDPRVWDPITERHRAIHGAVECFPCRKKECRPNRCLDGITPDAVMAEIVRAMDFASGRARRDGGDVPRERA